MKKLVSLLVACIFVFASVSAKKGGSGIEDVQKGDFNLGLQLGLPPVGDWDKDMPMISLDASWVIASGFISTSSFGENGAVDLGLYYGICHYSREERGYDFGLLQNCILFRGAFHFQFLPKLDTYAGSFLGVNIWSPTGDSEWKTDSKACVGFFTGAKYYFTDMFGVKAELGHDLVEDNYPLLSGGITFRF